VPVLAEYDGPLYFRVNRAGALPTGNAALPLRIGKGLTLRPGRDVTIIAAGTMVGRSLQAAEELAQRGVDARVIEMHTIKPLDVELVAQAAGETGALVTAEEHSVIGGLGSAVAEALAACYPAPLERVGIHDTFARTAPGPEELMDAFGLAVGDVAAAAVRAVARKRGHG
jgi:transketolase